MYKYVVNMYENPTAWSIDLGIEDKLEIFQEKILVVRWATRPLDLVAQNLFLVVPGIRTPVLSGPDKMFAGQMFVINF